MRNIPIIDPSGQKSQEKTESQISEMYLNLPKKELEKRMVNIYTRIIDLDNQIKSGLISQEDRFAVEKEKSDLEKIMHHIGEIYNKKLTQEVKNANQATIWANAEKINA